MTLQTVSFELEFGKTGKECMNYFLIILCQICESSLGEMSFSPSEAYILPIGDDSAKTIFLNQQPKYIFRCKAAKDEVDVAIQFSVGGRTMKVSNGDRAGKDDDDDGGGGHGDGGHGDGGHGDGGHGDGRGRSRRHQNHEFISSSVTVSRLRYFFI